MTTNLKRNIIQYTMPCSNNCHQGRCGIQTFTKPSDITPNPFLSLQQHFLYRFDDLYYTLMTWTPAVNILNTNSGQKTHIIRRKS